MKIEELMNKATSVQKNGKCGYISDRTRNKIIFEIWINNQLFIELV